MAVPCLIIDQMHNSIVPLLTEVGLAPDYQPNITKEALFEEVGKYEVLVVRSKIAVNEALLQRATRLRVIARAGAGLDQLDMDAIEARNIQVVNAPEGNRDALAEHAIGILLALFNKINLGDAQVRSGQWDREGNRGVELMGKTVGLIGYGYMGQAFAQRLSGFGCHVLAYDKYKDMRHIAHAEAVGLDQLYAQTDVLSLHVPLTDETHHMVTADFIDRFEKPLYILNTARGKVLVLKDLLQQMEQGKVLGAALDVLENEKLHTLTPSERAVFEALINKNNVILTPHVGGWTHESYRKINEVLANKLKAVL